MKQKQGYYIEFSGVDGIGKSTQARLLSRLFAEQGYPFSVQDQYPRTFYTLTEKWLGVSVSVREAYKVETAEVLMLCDEILHYYECTLSLLRQGVSVISARSIQDRYVKAKLFRVTNVADIQRICGCLPPPALHFYLKGSFDTIFYRIKKRGTDSEDSDVIRRYIRLADKEAVKQNWIIIDGNEDIDYVKDQIKTITKQKFGWQGT